MNKLPICLVLFLILFSIGCSGTPKEVVFTKETFSKIDISKVTEVSADYTDGSAVPSKQTVIFTITDREKIETIYNRIRKARDQIVYLTDELKFPLYRIYFKAGKVLYWGRIEWDEEDVYGDWWESADLLKDFKQWGLNLSKPLPSYMTRPPNIPPWIKTFTPAKPPRESDPNFPRLPPIKIKEE